MLASLFLLFGCVALLVIGGAIFMFSFLFTRRRGMLYGYPRRRSFFPWLLGRPFMGGDFYERRPRYEDRPHHERHTNIITIMREDLAVVDTIMEEEDLAVVDTIMEEEDLVVVDTIMEEEDLVVVDIAD